MGKKKKKASVRPAAQGDSQRLAIRQSKSGTVANGVTREHAYLDVGDSAEMHASRQANSEDGFSKPLRIVIDMQGAQTESRFRGIGRYTLSLVQAIVRNRKEHEIILALSGLFPETIENIRATFDGLLPQDNIRVWYAPGPVREIEPGNDWHREVAEYIREAFLASLQPDVVLVSSLFEGYIDDAVTSIGVLAPDLPTVVIFYDLIPLLNPAEYLEPAPAYARCYQRKIQHLKRAVHCLAISEAAAQEGHQALGLSDDLVTNISTACDAIFQTQEIPESIQKQQLARFNITQPFILNAGGADVRKNLPRLIKAYSRLPKALLDNYQLVLAGKMPDGNIEELKHIAKAAGLGKDQLCFTGYISDKELVQLYNLCAVFVFPSLHEGFGLPALEAMSCGAPVIGANTSSVPEVIGRSDALFDPHDEADIALKMTQVLQDQGFRASLREHGLHRAKHFSWDESARRAVNALESAVELRKQSMSVPPSIGRKSRLAFVSPLPPERTGIADYSAELLPALSLYYDIDLVVDQNRVDDPWVIRHGKLRDTTWLRTHVGEIDRVLYQVGNSPFHQYMLPLIREIPGTVVLHDFYISGLLAWQETQAGLGPAWTKALYASHGYSAVRERFIDAEKARREFPVNWSILQYAQGVIFTSDYSRNLVEQWYGKNNTVKKAVIPLFRSPAVTLDKAVVRKQLGIADEDFVVCSFGYLDTSKLNHCLLQAWLESALSRDQRCLLVFVGENHGGDYGSDLLKTIRGSGSGERIRITGFVSVEIFRQYLAAADIAVQLRAQSRGEASAAVLDCMNHGLPVIVNAHASMAELDSKVVWMLADEFDNTALVKAMETLWREPERRRTLGELARKIIRKHHAPAECAKGYAESIEFFFHSAQGGTPGLVKAIAATRPLASNEAELLSLAKSIAATLPHPRPAKSFFLDITATCRNDLKTGIERVARALTLALLEAPPSGYRIEPVYLSDIGGKWHYRFARRYTLALLNCPPEALDDQIAEPECGDVLLGLDLSGDVMIEAVRSGLFAVYRDRGVSVYFMVHDLLPIRMPEVFPPGANQGHVNWLRAVFTLDGAICVSKAVADDLALWQSEEGLVARDRRAFHIAWSHHGADLANSAPSGGMPANAEWTLSQLRARHTFLMVGTIEPRKGQLQTIEAFSRLWDEGFDVNLVVVGREGWIGLPERMRRDIPKAIDRLQLHPELNKHLFWLDDISDEYLEKVYTASTCLIAASYGEGFGLPLIEAAQHGLPIIARDIPVFREVAGMHAYYFVGMTPSCLSKALVAWLYMYKSNKHPKSDSMPWLTWKESATRLHACILGASHVYQGVTDELKIVARDEHLN